ncbi:MAG: thioredoxin fold domain-containing protein [Gammaproteobacteria bacterium]
MMKTIFTMTLFLLASLAQAEGPRDPYKFFFNETWGDFSEELTKARDEGKKGVLFFFEMDECPFCHYMKTNVLNQPEVQAYFREHFLSFPVDIEGDIDITTPAGEPMKQKEFAFKTRVRATPVFVIYDLEGNPIHRHTGKTAGVTEFMWIGEYIVDGHYKNMKYLPFKRSKRQD